MAQPRRNIVGCRIQHIWKEGSGAASQWKGTVLDQVPVNPSLYLIKYDGFDCVYGLELHKDERVQGLEVLPDRLGTCFTSFTDSRHCRKKRASQFNPAASLLTVNVAGQHFIIHLWHFSTAWYGSALLGLRFNCSLVLLWSGRDYLHVVTVALPGLVKNFFILRRSIKLSLDPLLGYQQEERLLFLNRQRNSHFLVVKKVALIQNSCVRSFTGCADLNLPCLLCLVSQWCKQWRFSLTNQWSAEFTRHVLVKVWLAWWYSKKYQVLYPVDNSPKVNRAVPCSGRAPL